MKTIITVIALTIIILVVLSIISAIAGEIEYRKMMKELKSKDCK